MGISRVLVGMAAAALVAGCGVDGAGDGSGSPAGVDVVPSVAEPATDREALGDVVARAVELPAAATAEVRRPEVQDPEQPFLWPAADVVFATPEEAAADFVREVLISDGEPELGEFQQGDSRSGEIEVFFPGETDDAMPTERGRLSLRQLGPSDGWFVIGADSDGAEITTPGYGETVAAAPVTVEGAARGFESTVVVSAFPAGDVSTLLDREIASGGAFSDVEPYSATLDLSGAAAGETVVILVQGDTGLGSDPGDFVAIPVVVAQDVIPATR